MSNQVTNFISFGNEPEQVAAFHKMLRELRQEDGVYGSLDFNKLIPMPEPMNISRRRDLSAKRNVFGS